MNYLTSQPKFFARGITIGQMDAFVFDTAIKVVPLLLLHTALRAREWRTNQTSRKG